MSKGLGIGRPGTRKLNAVKVTNQKTPVGQAGQNL